MTIFRHAPDAVEFAAGTELCRQGDAGTTLFAIVEGQVEITRDGRRLEQLSAGQFFGEMSLIDHCPRSATARATTACRIAVINEKQFLYMVQQTPFFAIEVMRTLTARLRHRLDELGNEPER